MEITVCIELYLCLVVHKVQCTDRLTAPNSLVKLGNQNGDVVLVPFHPVVIVWYTETKQTIAHFRTVA